MLLHFHHYPKDNSLTSGYMKYYFYLKMAFLVLGFSTNLYSTPKNVMNTSWTCCKIARKKFGPIFLFHDMF